MIMKSLKSFLFLAATVLLSVNLSAQTLQWEYSYTTGTTYPGAAKMATHSTGSYSAGTDNSSTNRKMLRLLKLSTSGGFLYSKSFTFGSAVTTLTIQKILVDGSGNCYLLMETNNTTSGGIDTWVYSYSSTLGFRWGQLINFDTFDRAADMTFTKGGKILVMVNYTASTAAAITNVGVKRLLTSNGSTDLTKNLTSTYNKQAVRIESDTSGGFAFCGRNFLTPVNYQAMLVKYSSTGSYQWARYYTSPTYISGNLEDYFRDLVFDVSGNVFAAGDGGNYAGLGKEGFVRKYNGTTGALQASHLYSTSTNDYITHARLSTSGALTVAGFSGNTTTTNVFFRRLNNSLSTVQATGTRNISSTVYTPYTSFSINDVLLNPNGSVVFAYFTGNGATVTTYYSTLLKLNSSGGFVFENSFNGTPRQLCAAPPTNFPNNEFLFLCVPHANTGAISGWKVRKYTSPASRFENDEGLTENEPLNVTLYPNPATNQISLSGIPENTPFYIYDLQGRLMLRGNAESHQLIDISNLSTGTYQLVVANDTAAQSKRLIIAR
jgi:hypothetical protein